MVEHAQIYTYMWLYIYIYSVTSLVFALSHVRTWVLGWWVWRCLALPYSRIYHIYSTYLYMPIQYVKLCQSSSDYIYTYISKYIYSTFDSSLKVRGSTYVSARLMSLEVPILPLPLPSIGGGRFINGFTSYQTHITERDIHTDTHKHTSTKAHTHQKDRKR